MSVSVIVGSGSHNSGHSSLYRNQGPNGGHGPGTADDVSSANCNHSTFNFL